MDIYIWTYLFIYKEREREGLLTYGFLIHKLEDPAHEHFLGMDTVQFLS